MKHSTDHIITTHVASLPRPKLLADMMRSRGPKSVAASEALNTEIDKAVHSVVERQVKLGIDVVSDGEMSKPSFLHYVRERLNGLEETSDPLPWYLDGSREFKAFPEFYTEELERHPLPPFKVIAARGPVSYRGQELVQADIARFKSALAASGAREGFMPAISPSNVEFWIRNDYYKTQEEYLTALADAMRLEYQAIIDAGLILQVDDPRLITQYTLDDTLTVSEYRKWAELHVEAMNYALRDIPTEKIRLHTCYSHEAGPRTSDVELKAVADIMLKVRAGALSFEAANPRHEHEWKVWRDLKVPDDMILIPGVIANSTLLVEHPETICDRIVRFAEAVGRERVIAGADCGFGSFAAVDTMHESIVWAKFEALVAGARMASAQLGLRG